MKSSSIADTTKSTSRRHSLMARCTATKQDGERCSIELGEGKEGLCLWHDPARKAEAQAARRRGNENRDEPVPEFSDLPEPTTLDAVAGWQARIAVLLAKGDLSSKRARDLTYALRAQREVLERTEQGRQAEELLEAVREAKRARRAG